MSLGKMIGRSTNRQSPCAVVVARAIFRRTWQVASRKSCDPLVVVNVVVKIARLARITGSLTGLECCVDNRSRRASFEGAGKDIV